MNIIKLMCGALERIGSLHFCSEQQRCCCPYKSPFEKITRNRGKKILLSDGNRIHGSNSIFEKN